MVCAKTNYLIAAMTFSCMTPQQIAEAAGVSTNVVYRMRRGYLVKLDAFGKVCRVLGIDPSLVIDFERMQAAGKGTGEEKYGAR